MRHHPAVVLAAILLSTLLLPLTLTGASIALPQIGADLHADLASVQWVVNGYNATFASFMLATGSLADLLGRRRVYAAGVGIFTVAGGLSAVAGDIVLLDVVRALGGIGAAAAATSASAILAATFHGRARARAFGVFGTVLGAGLAFGPSLAGLLIEAFGWRAVFAVPAILGAVVLALVPLLPESREATTRRIDWAGTASFTAALLLVISGFVEGPVRGWSDPLIVAAFVGAVVLLGVFVRVERRRPDPMFDLGLLASPRFLGMCVAAATIVSVVVPLLVYLPSYFTRVIGWSPAEAGAAMILLTAPTLVLPLLTGVLIRRIPPSAIVVTSVGVIALGAAWLTVLGPHADVLTLAGPLLTIGVGNGLSIGMLDGEAIGSVAPDRAGTAAGMLNTARLANETIAIAVVGSVLATTTAGQLADPGFTTGLRTVFWSLAGLAAAAVLLTATLLRRRAPVPVPVS
ncbi:Major Facilitator Superfamily protein [Micromonospora pattaloongensis]|uniref:Major Facilitator Superfamily protein n=1 Tax=Micromonospora pattaloongensis TaxID=405436 RepID=A0A1H3LYQ5_9ACTN|nr:MFS transporter [Micromonospora pattaloongensis]SDY69466.1 Major Facilitator Superfamily protein [Micromonospora pattaloongensis]